MILCISLLQYTFVLTPFLITFLKLLFHDVFLLHSFPYFGSNTHKTYFERFAWCQRMSQVNLLGEIRSSTRKGETSYGEYFRKYALKFPKQRPRLYIAY